LFALPSLTVTVLSFLDAETLPQHPFLSFLDAEKGTEIMAGVFRTFGRAGSHGSIDFALKEESMVIRLAK